MSLKKFRLKNNLSQEQLAEFAGLSLRTVQRAESGQNVAASSWRALADFFDVSSEELKKNEFVTLPRTSGMSKSLRQHLAIQLVILATTFFICVGQWLGYYASLNPPADSANLGTIVGYLAQIALAAVVVIYVFSGTQTVFVRSYYATTSVFLFLAIGTNYATQDYSASPGYPLVFPVFFALMFLTLFAIHVLQAAWSLRDETQGLIKLKSEVGAGTS